jgi:hypothetical protein
MTKDCYIKLFEVLHGHLRRPMEFQMQVAATKRGCSYWDQTLYAAHRVPAEYMAHLDGQRSNERILLEDSWAS